MNNIFIQLAIILTLSSALGLITYKLKLPILIAYLLGGLLLAATATFDISKAYVFTFLPDIGIAFVLFLVGMELDLREIKNFGKQILTAGILQVIISSTLGTFLAQTFGFNLREAIYLGVGLSFSSTILVVKLLLDRKDLTSLYGKLSVGVLLLEDLLAVLILLGLTSSITFANVGYQNSFLYLFVIKVLMLFVLAWIVNRFILSAIFKAVSESQELLFLTALAWCFAYIALAILMGFSILIGAFIAGVALASSPYHFQIQGKVKPMRDFFLALFFVYLGTRVNFADLGKIYPLILIFSTYAVFIKPVIFLLLFGIFGFKKHTMFHTAINLSQVSEFSLIILLVGLKMEIVSSAALTVIALSSVLSFIASSLMISHSNKIYKHLSKVLSFFERKDRFLEGGGQVELKDHVVVIGCHQVGERIVKFLKRQDIPLVILDFNPYQVDNLSSLEMPVIFGDMGDPEILDLLNLDKARLVVSTVSDIHDNQLLIEELKARNLHMPVIVKSDSVKEAKQLYKFGASLVFIPDIVSGEFLVEVFKNHLDDREYFKDRPRIELEKLSRKTLAWE